MSVGVVIPAYRCAATIARAVESCLSHVDARNIVIALDGPDAAAEAAIRDVSRDVRIVVLPNRSGAPACRNQGLAQLDTDYVIFLDSDDYVEGAMLESAEQAAVADSADVVLAPFCFEMLDGHRRHVDPAKLYSALDRDTIVATWLVGGYTPPCAVVWRAQFLRDMGGWDETLAKNQDGDLMYRALFAGAHVATSSQGLGIYVQSDDPGRITRSNSEVTLVSQFEVLDRVRRNLPHMRRAPTHELAQAYYGLARLAYEGGCDRIGFRAESLARELGLRGQTGSRAHVVVATILGLRAKQRLTKIVRRSARRLTQCAA